MKGCACARFEFWASPCVQFMSAPSMFIRGDGMQMRESDVGENPPNSGMVYLSGESQTPPAYPDRADENEAGIRAQWGELPMNLPEAAHVASTAPPAARLVRPSRRGVTVERIRPPARNAGLDPRESASSLRTRL